MDESLIVLTAPLDGRCTAVVRRGAFVARCGRLLLDARFDLLCDRPSAHIVFDEHGRELAEVSAEGDRLCAGCGHPLTSRDSGFLDCLDCRAGETVRALADRADHGDPPLLIAWEWEVQRPPHWPVHRPPAGGGL